MNPDFPDLASPEQETEQQIERPRLYKVLLVNDDFTPMDFVVAVLIEVFHMELDKAWAIMMDVHEKGRGVCGVFVKDIAEAKAAQIHEFARLNDHPLLAEVEPE